MKYFLKELYRKITGRQDPSGRRIFYAMLVVIFIFIISGAISFCYNKYLNRIDEYSNPPKVEVSMSIGLHLFNKTGTSASLDQKAYLVKVADRYKIIFELRNDFIGLPTTLFIIDSEEYCKNCYYHTLEFRNVGAKTAKNILFDYDTFTNKIETYDIDRKISMSNNFGGYGSGGIRFKIERLDIGESARIAFRVDNPRNNSGFKCIVDDKFGCISGVYNYKLVRWDENGIIFNQSRIFNFPKDLKEGFYDINLRDSTLTPIKMDVISKEFGVKHLT